MSNAASPGPRKSRAKIIKLSARGKTLPKCQLFLLFLADKPEYEYISEVSFNGKKLDTMFITYDELLQGGTLEFKLSDTPAESRK